MAAAFRLFLFIVFLTSGINLYLFCPRPSGRMQKLKNSWQNTPPSWNSSDPCGIPWEGVTCKNSRVTALDLSFNPDLTGPLTPRLGDLKNLTILIPAGCGFTGSIPDELDNLSQLLFLALNSNNLTGSIPPSLCKISNVYWIDLADNQLTGQIPISTASSPGLNLLKKAKHFHFNNNQLSGSIPAQLFSSDMVLMHVLFDGNKLNGAIPDTIGLMQTLEVLDAFGVTVPRNLNNLTNLVELNLAHNNLTGPIPNLTQMNRLNYVDLSNSSFETSDAPTWFSTLPSLTTLVLEYGSLEGPLSPAVFRLPQIQQVLLKNNAFIGQLIMAEGLSPRLQVVDLQNNNISSLTLTSNYTNTLKLEGNPVCEALSNASYCQPQMKPYSISLAKCGNNTQCPDEQKMSPESCECGCPYEGTMYFRAPCFRNVSDAAKFQLLEMSLRVQLELPPGSVFLWNPVFNVSPAGKYFNSSEVLRIGFEFSNQTYKPPSEFGPYFFIATPYPFPP